jgi:hypothetical protein
MTTDSLDATCRTKKDILRSVVFLHDEYHMVFQEKEGGSENGGHRYISNATDCDDRTQEREIHLFFFVFVQNARICQDRKD